MDMRTITMGETLEQRIEQYLAAAPAQGRQTEAYDLLTRSLLALSRLRRDCAELYQVLGTMAGHCPDPDCPAIVKALDNASDAANGDPRSHDDLLPFILPEPKS
jgi:hypothetical protein